MELTSDRTAASALKGKLAVITGGTSGIGEGAVRRFRMAGAEVVFVGRSQARGGAIAEQTGAVFLEGDVSEESTWARVSDTVVERWGRLDILVNNAGRMGLGDIESISLADWNTVLAANLTSVMLGCKTAIGLMRRNAPPGGAIVNISSTAAHVAIPDDVAYTASKSGVEMLTKSVAVYCARKGYSIRCNAVSPGAVRTAIHDELRAAVPEPQMIDTLLASISPMGRSGTPDEVAALIAFLASDEASFVNGSVHLVDGAALAGHPGV